MKLDSYAALLLPSFTREGDIKSHKRLAIHWLFFTAKTHTREEIFYHNRVMGGPLCKLQNEHVVSLCQVVFLYLLALYQELLQ